jgi:hypothetical protein
MKVKTLVASIAIAAAPLGALASGSATNPSGPQGTGWYGWVDPLLDDERYGVVGEQPYGVVTPAYDRNADGVITQAEYAASAGDTRIERRASYSGPSWATNPPVPPQ